MIVYCICDYNYGQ